MSLILSGTDGLSDVDGSAATPAIRGTDANTGIFFPAADTIAFAEGGAEVARFNSSGQLGVGTATVATNFRAQFLGTAGSNTSAASSGTTQSASAVLRLQAGGGFTGTLEPSGNIQYVYIFGAIAVFMLLIACINFMNLSTAGASKRAKEVGVRKVLGSIKQDLITYDLWSNVSDNIDNEENVIDESWQYWSASTTWAEILAEKSQEITLLSLDGKEIFDTYVGLSFGIVNDNSVIDVTHDSIVIINDITWDEYLV
jgi:hypothetical protein